MPEDVDFQSISEFFSEVAKGYCDAQVELDRLTTEYNNHRLGSARPGELPAGLVDFRIPSVEASITFGVKKSEKTKLGIVFVNWEKSKEKQTLQEVKFTIDAVPASPESLASQARELSTPEARALKTALYAQSLRAVTQDEWEDIRTRLDNTRAIERTRRLREAVADRRATARFESDGVYLLGVLLPEPALYRLEQKTSSGKPAFGIKAVALPA